MIFQVKIEPLEYCPVNEIKNEVLSQLFDCEPHLLLQPGQEGDLGDLGPPAETGAGLGAGEAGESIRMKKQELQVNIVKLTPFNHGWFSSKFL